MVLGYLYVLLSILDDLLRKVVMKTGEKMKSNNKPAPRLLHFLELLHSAIDQRFLTFVELFASVKGVNHDG